MRLEDQIYFSCAAYSSIHPNRAAVLNHLFCVLGNGYEWENGALVECCGDTTTKSGKRLSMQAAINKVFRNRRKNDEFRKSRIRNEKRREKRAFTHSKSCPIITRCNCGMWHIDDTDHNKWCARNFPEDIKCNCGAQARIDAAKPQDAKLDKLIEDAIAAMKKAKEADPVAFEAKRTKQDEEFKALRRKWREAEKWEYRVPADIKQRVKDTANFDNWYPISMDYPSNLLNFPDDIKREWLDAIVETAELICESYGRFEREGGPAFTNYGLHTDPDGSHGKKATRATYVVANAALHKAQELKLERKEKRAKARRKGIK
jgi:hypothetical protein